MDTLDAVAAAQVRARVVALTGDLGDASAGDEIRSASPISQWCRSAVQISPNGWPTGEERGR